MKRFVITLLLAVISFWSIAGTYYYADTHAYNRGLWDGAKMVIESCYGQSEGAAYLNGDTGHALLCQGVDTGVVDKTAGITVLTPPRDIPDVVVPESDAEITRKLKNPKNS